jgi:hypothetical protein
VATIQQHLQVRPDEARDGVWLRRIGRLKRQAWKRRLTNLFIVWQIFAVAAWLMPGNWPIVRNVLAGNGGPLRDYMVMSGFQQGWSMYAPNPDDRDIGISVIITYQDKTKRTWTMPRVKAMGYFDRYRKERFRKWAEVGTRDAVCWYPMARFAVRQCGIDPHNRPVSALLLQTITTTPTLGRPPTPPKTNGLCLAVFRPGDVL